MRKDLIIHILEFEPSTWDKTTARWIFTGQRKKTLDCTYILDRWGSREGSRLLRNLAEMMPSQQTVSGVGIYSASSLQAMVITILQSCEPRIRDVYFWVSIYREETVTQNVELLSIFGSLAIFMDLHLDLKAKLIGDRLLSSLTQTLFWEEIHHPGCVSQGTECFHSRNRNDHPCSSILCWSTLTLFRFIHFHLFIHKPNEFSFLRVSLQNEAPRTYFCLTHFVFSFQILFWFCLAVSLHWSVSSAPDLITLKGSEFIVAATAPSIRFSRSCLLLESHSRNLWRWRGNETLPTEPGSWQHPDLDSCVWKHQLGVIPTLFTLGEPCFKRVCVSPDVSSKAMPSENSTSMSLINPSWRQFLKRLHISVFLVI